MNKQEELFLKVSKSYFNNKDLDALDMLILSQIEEFERNGKNSANDCRGVGKRQTARRYFKRYIRRIGAGGSDYSIYIARYRSVSVLAKIFH